MIAKTRRQLLTRGQLLNYRLEELDVAIGGPQFLEVALELTFANDRAHSLVSL